ncbi:hypothetical protein [Ideonella sp.]|uniref:hypothetical protein n=1 Tax=Ideonella sp. TaxID=1929293 RepID=UPI0035ADEF0E
MHRTVPRLSAPGPITLTNEGLHLRSGVLGDHWVPRSAILAAEATAVRPRRGRQRLRLTGVGRANVLIRLRPGTRLGTPFGERVVSEIVLGVDEPARLLAALRRTDTPGPPPQAG